MESEATKSFWRFFGVARCLNGLRGAKLIEKRWVPGTNPQNGHYIYYKENSMGRETERERVRGKK